ncbi:DNA replication complex GINS family protein [Candidatus Micrarchaeota archaeon]|nr:DNA replication complex GINS family protein [Candidatus Micrarchaeota archaeon]
MISYSYLREIQKKEVESAALTKLDGSFYEQVAEFLKKKKEEALSTNSILSIKEYENIKKVVISIQSKREEKLFLLSLRGQAVDGLTESERTLFENISTTVQKYRDNVFEVLSKEGHDAPRIKKIKIVKDVEQYKGLDNNVYGPFKTGEEALLPMQEVEWLLKSHLAELL